MQKKKEKEKEFASTTAAAAEAHEIYRKLNWSFSQIVSLTVHMHMLYDI